MMIRFLLNGEPQEVAYHPTRTLLDWLREERGLTGTKEGCNEGDCGACTVMVQDAAGAARALNACILFLPQIDGMALRSVEGVAAPDGSLHPVQEAMIAEHGSQCGFCTPGFIMSMATAHLNGAKDHDDQLAGNLCRCTGYAPIVRAAQSVEDAPRAEWLASDPDKLALLEVARERPFAPKSSDDLARWYEANPEATLIAGATDVGLWVTKAFRDLGEVAFLNRCEDLKQIEITDGQIRIGAMVTIANLREFMTERHPRFAEMLRRYGSQQVRNSATIGGNIANGSPIGDSPPALIALGAHVHLRKGDKRREIALEDFFVDYGQQDRAKGEFVEAITLAEQADNLHVFKISKRFDQDISALCGAFNIQIEGGVIQKARIAFGGMAGTPKRARHVEDALTGKPATQATIDAAQAAFSKDFQPLSDMRASASYRLETAQAMLARCFPEFCGTSTDNVLEVRA